MIITTKQLSSFVTTRAGDHASSNVRQLIANAVDQLGAGKDIKTTLAAAELCDKIENGTGDLELNATEVSKIESNLIKLTPPFIFRQLHQILQPIPEDADLKEITG